jgi:quercetin dioxygenase-like cupin family protein
MTNAGSKHTAPRRLARAAAPALLLLAGLLLAAERVEAQRVVMVYEEPRHRLVHQDEELKLLDVQILPGDTTLQHTHDSAILYTFISQGSGPAGGRVSSITSYVTESFTHAVSNAGPHLFRILALANYGPAVGEGEDAPPDGLAEEPELENPWFRSYRLQLGPGEETTVHRHRNPVVVIQVDEGRTEVSKENGFHAELTRMGDWTWRDAESAYTIRNAGDAAVSVVVNEGRRR